LNAGYSRISNAGYIKASSTGLTIKSWHQKLEGCGTHDTAGRYEAKASGDSHIHAMVTQRWADIQTDTATDVSAGFE